MKNILFLFILLIGGQAMAANQKNCDCQLTEFVSNYITENPINFQDTLRLKELSEGEFTSLVKKMCTELNLSQIRGFDSNKFLNHILEAYNIDADDVNSNTFITNFLNKYKNKIICPDEKNSIYSRDMHLYKSALFDGIFDLFDEILFEDEVYEIDFNGYEIINGKKETVLDYIDYLIDIDYGDVDELKSIKDVIIELGGKYGKEL